MTDEVSVIISSKSDSVRFDKFPEALRGNLDIVYTLEDGRRRAIMSARYPEYHFGGGTVYVPGVCKDRDGLPLTFENCDFLFRFVEALRKYCEESHIEFNCRGTDGKGIVLGGL